MAVKTTKIQCNQDVDLRGKVDVEGKVTCGNDVDVDGKLTINTASDLKTKDGTGFGEGLSSPWFSSNEYIGIQSKSNPTSQVNDYVSGLYNIDGTVVLVAQNSISGVSGGFMPSLSSDFPLFLFQSPEAEAQSFVQLPEEFFTSSMIINLGDINTNKVNIDKKQSTLYRHTVTFSESGLGYQNVFTSYSEKNTPIDSIQDLITVFGNTKLQCSGTIESGSNTCVRIDIGTTADTILFIGMAGATQKLSSWYSTGPESTLTITDNVTAM